MKSCKRLYAVRGLLGTIKKVHDYHPSWGSLYAFWVIRESADLVVSFKLLP